MNYIIDPNSNKKLNIFSREGRNLLKKYIQQYNNSLTGGSRVRDSPSSERYSLTTQQSIEYFNNLIYSYNNYVDTGGSSSGAQIIDISDQNGDLNELAYEVMKFYDPKSLSSIPDFINKILLTDIYNYLSGYGNYTIYNETTGETSSSIDDIESNKILRCLSKLSRELIKLITEKVCKQTNKSWFSYSPRARKRRRISDDEDSGVSDFRGGGKCDKELKIYNDLKSKNDSWFSYFRGIDNKSVEEARNNLNKCKEEKNKPSDSELALERYQVNMRDAEERMYPKYAGP